MEDKLRPIYVTIEGEQSDIAKDLKYYIVKHDELKQQLEMMNGIKEEFENLCNLRKQQEKIL
jgi:hypothetical protein